MGVKKAFLDTVVGIHPSSAEELVTMRTPTRKIRDKQPVEAWSAWSHFAYHFTSCKSFHTLLRECYRDLIAIVGLVFKCTCKDAIAERLVPSAFDPLNILSNDNIDSLESGIHSFALIMLNWARNMFIVFESTCTDHGIEISCTHLEIYFFRYISAVTGHSLHKYKGLSDNPGSTLSFKQNKSMSTQDRSRYLHFQVILVLLAYQLNVIQNEWAH